MRIATWQRKPTSGPAEPRFPIAERRLSSACGPLWLACSERGPVALGLGDEASWRAGLARRGALVAAGFEETCERVAAELAQWLAGTRTTLEARPDLRGLSAFQQRVLAALAGVPWGATTSYGALAARIGQPGAARAVGRAMASNPLPLYLPCHRVLAGDGGIGGFSAGLEWKIWLLRREGAVWSPGPPGAKRPASPESPAFGASRRRCDASLPATRVEAGPPRGRAGDQAGSGAIEGTGSRPAGD